MLPLKIGGASANALTPVNGVLTAKIIPRAMTWAAAKALSGTGNEPADGEILFLTDIGNGLLAKWNGTTHYPDYYSHRIWDHVTAYWTMHQSSGNVLDESGNGSTLTNNNTVTFEAGITGNHAKFLAASSQTFTGTSNSFVQANSGAQFFAMFLWKLNGNTTNCYPLVKRDSGVVDWAFQYFGSDHLYFTAGPDTANIAAISDNVDYFVYGYQNPVTGLVGGSVTALTATAVAAESTVALTTGGSAGTRGIIMNDYGGGIFNNMWIEEVTIIQGRHPTTAEINNFFLRAKAGRGFFI